MNNFYIITTYIVIFHPNLIGFEKRLVYMLLYSLICCMLTIGFIFIFAKVL